MSGGVDSSVAAARLKAEGYDVIGLTLKIWEDEAEAEKPLKRWQDRSCCKVGVARYVAKQLGIPHEVVEARPAFERDVIDDFTEEYLNGRTPNPCVRCNERVKFGLLLQAALSSGADLVATGHYARVERAEPPQPSGRWLLKKAADRFKDQTYFLYRLDQTTLGRVLFPLGALQKAEVWAQAADLGFPAEEMAESQEVCFVTQRDYREFLDARAPEASRPGPIVTERGAVVGQHRGVAFYTVGQRRGLGVAGTDRLYVTALDPVTNHVVVGEEAALYTQALVAGDLNWIAIERPEDHEPPLNRLEPMNVTVKIRSRHPETPARLEPCGPDRVRLLFDTPQRAVSPGQSAVFYQGDVVIGGGIIQAK